MKTSRAITLAMTLCTASVSQGQAWNAVPGGNVINGTEYLGARAGSTVPLRFTTIPNLGMEWRTNNVVRMRLLGTNTTQVIGSYNNQTVSGNLGIGPFGSMNVTTPWSLIHLDNGGTQFSGYRPWQRAGMTITQGSDLGWIGVKNEGFDLNHMTLAWADNTVGDGPDVFKVLFLANPGTNGTAGNLNGLETMRIRPRGNGMESFFGIGDWFTAGLNPGERLDMLNGRLRIRQLPDDPETDQAFKVMVVDDTNDPNERGVVKWRNVSLGTGCDWVVQDIFPMTPPHVSNTYDGSNCTWDRRHGVGIGIQLPKFKLHVVHNSDALLAPDAIYGESSFSYEQGQWITGVHGRASTATALGPLLTMRAFGVRGSAFDARSSVGVYGLADITGAQGGGNATQTYGLMGRAVASGNSDHVVGVFGSAIGATDPMDDWAGWFEGNVNIQGGDLYINEFFAISDEALKTDIQDAPASVPIVDQLNVHSYQFNSVAAPSMNLPEGQRVGLLAQEVQNVLPHLVSEVRVPAKYDSLGTVVQESYSYKAVNYMGLIPYLIGAVQELKAENQTMQEQLAACCTAAPTDIDQRNGSIGTGAEEERLTPAQERALRIAPNPFTDRTTLYCNLERAGRMQLMANSADGRDLMVLAEGQRQAGEFQQVWSTENLAPGVYYITLLLNGEPVVKRAVKVGR